jgi:fibronectin type 3 domain-containing protein
LLADLAAGQDYYVAVRAVDRVGNVSPLAGLGRVRTPRQSEHQIVFADDVEGAARFIGKLPWAASKEQSWSPTRSYTDSPGQHYGFRTDSSLTQSAPVLLRDLVPVLSFRAMSDLEPGFDFLYVEVSADDGATWARQELALTGVDGWTLHQAPLGRYYGQLVRVRFRLVTDDLVNAQGVWLDDIRIGGDRLEAGMVPLPTAPSGLTAHAVARDRVDLAWQDRSDNEAGFSIERRTSAGPYVMVGAVGAEVTRFTDVSVNANTLYRYRVRAVNAGGASDPTAEVETLTPPAPPPPPGLVRAKASEATVELTWAAAVGAQRYRVHRGSTPGGPYLLLGEAAALSFADTSVGVGIRYYYVVTSVGPGGESVPSNEAEATPGLMLPAPPTHVRARAQRARVTVSWRQSASADISQNRIYRARSATGPFSLIATVRSAVRYRDGRVGVGGAYYYRVSAVDAAGRESPPSEQVGVAVGRRPF